MKFKIGDRVRCIDTCGWHKLKIGMTGTVRVEGEQSCGVQWDGFAGKGHECGGTCPNNDGFNLNIKGMELEILLDPAWAEYDQEGD